MKQIYHRDTKANINIIEKKVTRPWRGLSDQ